MLSNRPRLAKRRDPELESRDPACRSLQGHRESPYSSLGLSFCICKVGASSIQMPCCGDGRGHIHRGGEPVAGDGTHSRQRQGSWTQGPGGKEGKRLECQPRKWRPGEPCMSRWGPFLSSTLALTSRCFPTSRDLNAQFHPSRFAKKTSPGPGCIALSQPNL